MSLLLVTRSLASTLTFLAPSLIHSGLLQPCQTGPLSRDDPALAIKRTLDRPRRTRAIMVANASSSTRAKQSFAKEDLRDVARLLSSDFRDGYNDVEKRISKALYTRTLNKLYSVSRDKPFDLLIRRNGTEAVAAAWLLAAWLNEGKETISSYVKQQKPITNEDQLVPLLSNLVVRREIRGRGLARKIILQAEEQVKTWGYPALYVLVDINNTPAVRLYKSSGYEDVFSTTQQVNRPVSKFFGLYRTVESKTLSLICLRKHLPFDLDGLQA